MVEAIVNNLSAILFGLAALVSALAAFVSVWFNRGRLIETGAKLDAVDKKVDGGIARLQEALAEVAKIAAAAGKTVVVQGQRSTDPRVEVHVNGDVKP